LPTELDHHEIIVSSARHYSQEIFAEDKPGVGRADFSGEDRGEAEADEREDGGAVFLPEEVQLVLTIVSLTYS